MAAGSIIIDLLMRTGSFETDTKRAEKRLRDFQKSANDFGKKLGTAIGAGVAAGTAALTALTVQAINFADEINDMSQKVGVSTETLSSWGYAAAQSGTSIDALSSSLPKLAKNIAAAADETSRQADLFKALGIEVKDQAGHLRSVESVLPELADKFKALDNETTETALAMELLGKNGAEMLQFMNEGSDGIQKMIDRARELGVQIDGETAAAAGRLNDQIDDLRAMALGLGLDIAKGTLPALEKAVKQFGEMAEDGKLAANAVTLFTTAINAGVGTLDTYSKAVETLSYKFSQLESIGEILNTVFNPIRAWDLGGPLGQLRAIGEEIDNLNADQKLIDRINSGAGRSKGKQTSVLFSTDGAIPESMLGPKEDPRVKALQDRIDALLANRGGSKSSRGANRSSPNAADWLEEDTRKLRELVEAEAEAREAFEAFAAGLAGPVADANYQFATDMERLNELASKGAVGADELAAAQANLRKEHEANIEAIERQLNPGKELLNNLRFELELMKMGNMERQTAIALRGLEVEQIQKYGEEIAEANRKLEEQAKQVEVMDDFRDSFKGFFSDVLSGTKSISDSFEDMFDRISSMILDRIAQNWVDQLFGEKGQSGGGASGGWLGTISSLFSTSGGSFGGARAGGGDVWGNKAYLVGEQGPEMFVPNTAGTIIPAGRTAAMTRGGDRVQQINNFTINGRIDRRTEAQIVSEVGRKTNVALRRNGPQ